MIVYRLVDQKHDCITPGQVLTRTSNYSNQKFGDGMYFALDRTSALAFNAIRKYTYTHLLECDINYQPTDFVDLVQSPNLIVAWANQNSLPNSRKITETYCMANKKVGVIWGAMGVNPWVELVLLKQFVTNVKIINASPL